MLLPDSDEAWPDDVGEAMQVFLDESIAVLGRGPRARAAGRGYYATLREWLTTSRACAAGHPPTATSARSSTSRSAPPVEAYGRALRVELTAHGATAGVAYFGFIDTALVERSFAHRPVDMLRQLLQLLDGRLRKDARVQEAVRVAESGVPGDASLSTASAGDPGSLS